MSLTPEEPAPGIERLVEAISDGAEVKWEATSAETADHETLEALRLIDQVARLYRGAAEAGHRTGDGDGTEWTWGRLRVLDLIGTGVYGEVHRAFDPGLRREVALKLWNETARPRIIERLLDEARALARVRHPNVLVVHGADVHDGRVGMWTELLEGDTLEQLVSLHGPGHWREAALYGIDLCRALVAVHSTGFVHRDVKASNVMRERGGRIVLMDFGSASQLGAGDDAATGVQGTPLAMAPEVLRGEPATPAADLYSLGVLLFRMVSARYPVEAESLPALREALATGPVRSLRVLRHDVPLAFERVVAAALERDPARRPASAGEMERLLTEALSSDWNRPAPAAPTAAPPARRPAARGAGPALAAALVIAALLGGGWWLQHRPAAGTAQPMQFALQLPMGEHLSQYANVVVSPDGTTIAFAVSDSIGNRAVWTRRFDARTSTRIPGTEGASYPFWSPDSREVAFFTSSQLKRVGVDGGGVRVLCSVELGRGGSWNRSGTILFAASSQGPLFRVPAEGGQAMPATTLDAAHGEVSHRWPCFLPDGRHYLYVSTPGLKGVYSLYAGSLDSDRRAFIGPVESGAVYSSNVLVYVSNRTLEARPFNPRTLHWEGDPVPLADIPGLGGSLAEPHASVSQNGTMVYSAVVPRESRLEWIDAHSGAHKLLSVGPYFSPSLSPDGRRVAVERVEGVGRSNIWLVDAVTGAAERWTDDEGLNRGPRWSPGGDSLVFSSNRSGRYQLFVRATSGSLAERCVLSPPNALLMWPNDWRAGNLITYDLYEAGTNFNVYELRSGRPIAMARTAAAELRSSLSPDGRWLAYDSDASGRPRIYVMDRRTGERYVLPGDGGERPRWARGSGRLFYHSPSGSFHEVVPQPGRQPGEWTSRRLFNAGVLEGFDVDPAGERLLCCLKTEAGRPEEVNVLANLPQAVRRGL